MRIILYIIVLVSFFSCQKKQNPKNCAKPPKKLEMYQMSELAVLMERMYVENLDLKQRIIDKKPLGNYPVVFDKIYNSKFTDQSDNDAFFQEQAKLYIASNKLIYKNDDNSKQLYNNSINACITCHKKKCGGPIAKIKKLYIN